MSEVLIIVLAFLGSMLGLGVLYRNILKMAITMLIKEFIDRETNLKATIYETISVVKTEGPIADGPVPTIAELKEDLNITKNDMSMVTVMVNKELEHFEGQVMEMVNIKILEAKEFFKSETKTD